MKLLLYAHAFAPMIGGIETYTMLLATGLAEAVPTETATPRVTVVTQARSNGMDDSVLPFRVIRRPGVIRLVRMIGDADVIHIASPAFLPMLFAWLLRKPVVVEHDTYQSVCPNGLLFHEPTKSDCPGHFRARRFKECLSCNLENLGAWGSLRVLVLTFPRRWLCRRMTLHIGPSAHVAGRVGMPRTQVIYHGVRPPAVQFCPDSASSDVCFAFIGRMVNEKGVPILLRAAQQLANLGYDFRLKLIGDGPVRAELERMVDELDLRERTIFTGFLEGEALREAMKDVTAAVMPSICQDVAPLASIELMLDGRLVIASDIGGLGELVDDVGLKFSPGDFTALADCLRQVLEHPGLARQLGNRASERARALFTYDRMARDHLQAYVQIVPAKAVHGMSEAKHIPRRYS